MGFWTRTPAPLVLAAALLLWAPAAHAADDDPDPCAGADRLSDCWSGEAARADAEMRAAYDALLGRLRGEAADRLRKSQRLWLEFREAHLEMLYSAAEANQEEARRTRVRPVYLLGARAERLICAAIARRQMTVARTRVLKLLLEPPQDEGCPL